MIINLLTGMPEVSLIEEEMFALAMKESITIILEDQDAQEESDSSKDSIVVFYILCTNH